MNKSDPPRRGDWVIPLVDNEARVKYRVVGLIYSRDEEVVRLDLGLPAFLLWRNEGDWLLTQVKRA